VSRSATAKGLLAGIAVLLLVLAAIDSFVTGVWATLRPAELFAFLQASETPDAVLLCRALGALWIFQGVCLLIAAVRPAEQGLLVLLPLSGRALLCGVWLWLMGTDRVKLPIDRLELLLVHDAVWLPVFGGFLVVRRWLYSASKPNKDALVCLDSSSSWSAPSPQAHAVQPPPPSGSL
jgi:hypothetical protein